MTSRHARSLVLVGGMSGALYGVNLLVGATLSWAFGLFGLSGLLTGLTIGFTFYVVARLTQFLGSITLLWTLYSLFAIPTPLMGPPVPQKVIIGFCAGLGYDLMLLIFRHREPGYYIGFVVYTAALVTLFISIFVGPELEKYQVGISDTLKTVISAVFSVTGILSTWLGSRFFAAHISGTELERRFLWKQ
jgi:hypothetical protein